MNCKNKTILQILPSLQSGGVERGTIDIASALKESGFNPIIISSGGILVKELEKKNITHIKLDIGTKNPLKTFFNIRKINKIIKEHKVDLVHVRSRAPMWSAYFACKKNKVKLVSTIHGPYSVGKNFLTKFFKKIYNSRMLKADKVIVVSNFIKNYVLENYKVEENKLCLIHRGADINIFKQENTSVRNILSLTTKWNLLEEKRKIIVMPARFTTWKGHEFLVDALAKIADKNYVCFFVGSNHGHESYQKRLEKKIADLNLSEKIRIVGVCKDMASVYAVANFIICASIKPEAFGRVPIEAQSMKKPIIATKIGGALETVIDNKSGFLVEPNNIDEMVDAISKLLDFSDEQFKLMGEAGRKNIEDNFSNQKMINSTLEIYRQLL